MSNQSRTRVSRYSGRWPNIMDDRQRLEKFTESNDIL